MSLLLILQVLRRRSLVVGWTFLSTLVGALLVVLLVPARYDAMSTAAIDPSLSDPVSGQITSAQAAGIIQGNLVALAKSNQVALAVTKRLNMDSDPATQRQYRSSSDSGLLGIDEWIASQLLTNIDAKFGIGSNVLTITYKGTSPRQAADLANAFMSSFIDAAIGMKTSSAQRAADWFTPQIEKVRAQLAASREKLARFQLETKLLAASNSDAESDQLLSVTTDLSKAKAELVALQTQLDAPAPTAATSNDAQSIDIQTLISLRSNLSNIDADIAKTQTETGANNPRLLEKLATRQSLQKQIKEQIEDFRKKLQDRISSQKQRIASLQEAYNDRVTTMISVQGQREQLAALNHDIAFYQEELERIQKAANQAHMQSQLSFSNISILDSATPPTSVSFPKLIIVIPLAIGLGLALGVLLALLGEALDRRVRVGDDLAYASEAPLLGVMISIKPKVATRLSALRKLLPGSGRGAEEAQEKPLVQRV